VERTAELLIEGCKPIQRVCRALAVAAGRRWFEGIRKSTALWGFYLKAHYSWNLSFYFLGLDL
jgi:hypothetical protein